jgi:hypothetical protein
VAAHVVAVRGLQVAPLQQPWAQLVEVQEQTPVVHSCPLPQGAQATPLVPQLVLLWLE